MVEEHSKNFEQNCSQQRDVVLQVELKKKIRVIQQALTVEAERGFINIHGKEDFFNSFITHELLSLLKFPVPKDFLCRLDELTELFIQYPTSSHANRQRNVVSLRQFLYKLNKKIEPKSTQSRPRLKVSELPSSLSSKDITFSSSISSVKGVGIKIADRLSVLGIFNIKDLLEYYPRDYVDYSSLKLIKELQIGETTTIVASVIRCNCFVSPRNRNLLILELHLQDQTGRLKVTRFFAGRRFTSPGQSRVQSRLYSKGTTVAVSGLVKDGPYGKSINDPLIEVMESPNASIRSKSIGRLLPIYSLTEGLNTERFRDLIQHVLPIASTWPDPLPQNRRDIRSLLSKSEAIISIHRPIDQDVLKAARRRLVFDEFLLLQLGLLRMRAEVRSRPAPQLDISTRRDGLVGKFLELLPFELTGAQERVVHDIESDLLSSKPMARLLQGDVGSGKTIVALVALLHAVEAGLQGALMAPTEVLAEQHYRNFCKWLPQLHVNVELLTGSTTKSRRSEILKNLSNGSLKILVGTHALIEDPVSFSQLGLAVVDEQHRFGVHQRNRLLNKGLQPHLLAMTATPIPRTLALSLHGDLDVSQIDELPPGRRAIETTLLMSSERYKAYKLINDEVSLGNRAYIILPLVEESEKLDLRSAVEVHSQLSKDVFSELNVGLLHGRMHSSDKQRAIQDFKSGKCQVLVSTTVVEVGVDVPEATVMLIDHADRFGLSQLHQLRGRVGRGAQKSHCLLVNETNNPLARQRLEVLVRSNDGFEISEIDLRLRGPGQVLGTRQSGLPDFALASLVDDATILEEAREEAKLILKFDSALDKHPLLRSLLKEQWKRLSSNTNLN